MNHKRGIIIICGIIVSVALISMRAGNGKVTNNAGLDFTNKEETVIYVDIAWGEIVEIKYGGDFYGGYLVILFEDNHLVITRIRSYTELFKIERIPS